MKAGLATIALRNYDVFTALDMASGAGFAGVEIWGKPPHMPDGVDEDHTRRVRDRARSNGLEIPIFGSYANPSWPEFEIRSTESIMLAHLLGAKIIRVWAGNKEPHEADDGLWQQVGSAFHEFGLRAEDEGLTLAMEMHAATLCLTPQGAMRVIETAKAPNLKLNYQPGDFDDPNVERDLGIVADQVAMVHAQNFRRSSSDPNRMERCLIEEGTVDYDKALGILAAHGFKGYVEVEFLKGENVNGDVFLDSLRRDANYLKLLTARHSRSVS